MACPNLDGCQMYAEFKLKALLTVWKLNYCEGQHEVCARYRLKSRGELVPVDLLPNGRVMRKAALP